MGELAALAAALLWATSSTLVGSQTARVPAAIISAVQLLVASLMLWALTATLFLTGVIEGTSLSRAVALAGSALIGPGLGDMLYFAGIRMIGVARAFPISMAAMTLFILALAAAFLDEAVTLPVIVGAVLIIAGISLIAARRREQEELPRPRQGRLGIVVVLVAAVLWALSSVWLRVAAEGVAAPLASSIRMPAAAVFALLLAWSTGKAMSPAHYGRRSILALGAAGLLGVGAGSILFVIGIQRAGAARTAILSSTAPLFALPLAALALHERVTRRVAVGTVLSIAGIWLVTA